MPFGKKLEEIFIDAVEVYSFEEWKRDKRWLGGFAILRPGTSFVGGAFNLYRCGDGSVVALFSEPGYQRIEEGRKEKYIRRQQVTLDIVVFYYANMHTKDHIKYIKENGDGEKNSVLLIPEFKQLLALELL